MKRRTLTESINDAVTELNWISAATPRVRPGSLSTKSNDFFDSAPEFVQQLEAAKLLLPVRDLALSALKSFPTSESTTTPGQFKYNNLHVSFTQGRYLLLQSYLATTWAFYDALSRTCGSLCCTEDRLKNAVKPVKLPEDFLQAKPSTVGARMHEHLKGAYGWPAAISYCLRNWVVHDGLAHDGTELFKHDALTPGAEFEISDDAWSLIEQKCQDQYKANSAQTRLIAFPNIRLDVVEGLGACHQEVDECMSFLVLWSAHCLKLQVEFLCARDLR